MAKPIRIQTRVLFQKGNEGLDGLTNFLNSLNFATPLYFWIAGGLILLMIFYPWARKKRGLAIELQYFKDKVAFDSKRVWVLSVPVVIISLLIAGGLSNPQVITRPITKIYGYPITLAVDISGSMGIKTGELTGYEESLEAFNNLIARRGNLNFSLILYSDDAYVARYFVNKNEFFKDTLENKEEITEISNGTDITKALAKACQFLTDYIEGNDKIIILISDLDVTGKAQSSMIEEISRIALAGIKLDILTTGEGIKRAANIPQMAGLRIVDANDMSGIDQLCQEIYSMPMSLIREEKGTLGKSLIPLLILITLGLVSICLLLDETHFRKIP